MDPHRGGATRDGPNGGFSHQGGGTSGAPKKKTGPHQREDKGARNGVAQDNGGAVAVCGCSPVSGPLLALFLRNWANSCVAAADLTDARPKKRLAQAGPYCRSEKTQAGPNLGRATRLFWLESVRAQVGKRGKSGRSKTGALKSRSQLVVCASVYLQYDLDL